MKSLIIICLIGLGACACTPLTYTPNPGDPYDFKGDLSNLGGPPKADAPKTP
jgi:hypothetical protein